MGGAGYIPWSKAMEYAARVGLAPGDEQDRFWHLIHKMDTEEYLPWLSEKHKAHPDKK